MSWVMWWNFDESSNKKLVVVNGLLWYLCQESVCDVIHYNGLQ